MIAKVILEYEPPADRCGVYAALEHSTGEPWDRNGDVMTEIARDKAVSDWPKLLRALREVNRSAARMIGNHDPKALLTELANIATLSADAILAATQPPENT